MNLNTQKRLDPEVRALARMTNRIENQKPISRRQLQWWKTLRTGIESRIELIKKGVA